MQDNRFSCGPGIGKDTVCIETNRILDSCRDKDCFEEKIIIPALENERKQNVKDSQSN